jgi:DNA-binding beta-propeller fold protein YncE
MHTLPLLLALAALSARAQVVAADDHDEPPRGRLGRRHDGGLVGQCTSAHSALFNAPTGLAYNSVGDVLYVADTNNAAVRAVSRTGTTGRHDVCRPDAEPRPE